MKFHAERDQDITLVSSYDSTSLMIGDQRYMGSHLVASSGAVIQWNCTSFADLDAQDLEHLAQECANAQAEVLLLGTGAKMRFLPPNLRRVLSQAAGQSLGFEMMDTAAALRTYNVLALEGRKVLAALILE